MPRDIAFVEDSADRARGAMAQMLPVESASAVWSRIRREFGVRRVEQLPLRARLLDILEHLDRGNMLALVGANIPAVWLDGHPDVVLLAGVLFTYGYVQIAGRHRDNPNVVYFTLSDAGRSKLHQGRAWWNRLTFFERLRVRLLG